MWNDTRDCMPLADGTYLVQMAHGGLSGLEYTREGGWNTHYDFDGNLHAESAINDAQVARWFNAPTPPDVPDEWFYEAIGKKEAN